MGILVLGSEEVVTAFALGGMKGRVVAGRSELLHALDEIGNGGPGTVLAIEESFVELARDEIDGMKLEIGAPLVVEVPGPGGVPEARKGARELVRRALGIKI